MIKIAYKEPEFRVLLLKSEDVISTSVDADPFAAANGFVTPENASTPASDSGQWNMPGIEI
jgi:hypothetical protein